MQNPDIVNRQDIYRKHLENVKRWIMMAFDWMPYIVTFSNVGFSSLFGCSYQENKTAVEELLVEGKLATLATNHELHLNPTILIGLPEMVAEQHKAFCPERNPYGPEKPRIKIENFKHSRHRQ